MVNPDELRELIACNHEWLLVRELGKTFPLERHEIEITEDGSKVFFGFLDDNGYHAWRLNGFALNGDEIAIDCAGAFGKKREAMRLVPRTSAALLTAEIEQARLEKANEVANLIAENFHIASWLYIPAIEAVIGSVFLVLLWRALSKPQESNDAHHVA